VKHEFSTNRNNNNLNNSNNNNNNNENINDNVDIVPNHDISLHNEINRNQQNSAFIRHMNQFNQENSNISSDRNGMVILNNSGSIIRFDNYPFIRNRDQIVILN
jgi:hypothetical protein